MAPMTRVKRTALDRSLNALCQDLRVDEVKPHLISELTFSENDYELVESKVTSAEKVTELVRILKTKPDGAFEVFVEGLREVQTHLADDVMNHLQNPIDLPNNNVHDDEPPIPHARIGEPDRLVTDQELNIVAQGLGSDWEKVGRSLGLKQQQLYACKVENSHSLHDQIFAMLNKWKKKAKGGATRAAIVNELAKIEVDPEAYDFLLIQQ